jgi:hypothetical protein
LAKKSKARRLMGFIGAGIGVMILKRVKNREDADVC